MNKPYYIVYAILRAAGLTHEAALAMMGNWQCESLFDAFRRQGDLSEAAAPSHAYVAAVTSGAIGREQFARDQIGFGLAQWTYFNFDNGQGRKLDLWDFWQRSGQALDDPDMQAHFAVWELEHKYSGILEELRKSTNLYYCTDLICKRYEQPQYNNVGDRYAAAQQIETILASQPEEPAEDGPETPFWPPRMLCEGMIGSDVTLLQAALTCHGHNPGGCSGIFTHATTTALEDFQTRRGIGTDGICGPISWTALGLQAEIFNH